MTRARETTMQADLTHFGFVFAFANDQSATLREASANILQFWYAVAEAATPEPEPETDGKVECPVCERRVALRAGRINRHFNYGNEFDPTCPGSGRKL
jgi:hypothetical protein